MKTGWWGEFIFLWRPACREARGSPANPRFYTPVFSGAATDQPLICPGFFTPLYARTGTSWKPRVPALAYAVGWGRCDARTGHCRRGPKCGHRGGTPELQWVHIPVLTGLPRTKPHPLQQPVPFEKMMVKCRTPVKNKQHNHRPGTDSMWNTRQVIPEVRQRPGGPTKNDRPGT